MTVRTGNIALGPRAILLIIAIIAFALAAINVDVGTLSLTDVGLAFFAAAFLVP